MNNQQIIKKFFDAFSNNDMEAIRKVMDENVTWHFMGDHPFAGVKRGIQEVVDFFSTMAMIMGHSKPSIQKLIVADDGKYSVECQRVKTNREEGVNIDHHVTVLWTIEHGKITSGRHFFADQQVVDRYFNDISKSMGTPSK